MLKTIKWKIVFAFIALSALVQIFTVFELSIMAQKPFSEYVNSQLITYFIVILLFSSLVGYMIARIILSPIKRVTRNMKNISEGKIFKITELKDAGTKDEVGNMISTFNNMIKEIKENYVDLSSQKSKTDIILQNLNDGVIAFDIKGSVIRMNSAAMRLLKINENDDTFEGIFKKLNYDVSFEKLIYLPKWTSKEVKISFDNHHMSIFFAPFNDERYNPIGIIMVVKDVTEHAKLDNIRKEFVANVSHELKTPLTSIKGYSETILDGDLDKESINKFVSVIYSEANRMTKLVSDLLLLSRFDYNKVSWKKTEFNLGLLSKSILEEMRIDYEQKGHKVECFITSDVPLVYADKDSIEQVIINVLSNAFKYTHDNGEISIYVGCVHANPYIKVIDNGIGIPKKDLSRIYERFYRVDKARSREMGGTGLGLAIVKEIVESNGGEIEIKSEQNVGTEVIISLPTKADKKVI